MTRLLSQIQFLILIFVSIWNLKLSYNLIRKARKNIRDRMGRNVVNSCLLNMTWLLLSLIPSSSGCLQIVCTRSNWSKFQYWLGRNSISLTAARSKQLLMTARRVIFTWRWQPLLSWLYISERMCIWTAVVGMYYKIKI